MAINDEAAVRTRGTKRLGIDGYVGAVVIGQSDAGVVYRSRQLNPRRTVAIKVLSGVTVGDAVLRRFDEQRAAAGALVGHPNIVDVYDSNLTADGAPYVAMEYVARGSLADELRRMGPVEWRQVVAWGIKLAGALESAHRRGVIHGDIKAENILLSDYGEPKLADFGIAEIVTGRSAREASDISALASTLLDLTAEGAPASVQAVLDKAIANKPGERYGSALALGRALQQVEEERALARTELPVDVLPPPAPPAKTPQPLMRPAPAPPPASAPRRPAPAPAPAPRPARWRGPVIALIALVVVGVVIALVATNRHHSPSTPPAVLLPSASALAPGTYHSNLFQPPLTFTVGNGWTLATADTGTRLELTRGDTPGAALGFHLVDQVIDPASAPARGQDVDPTVLPLPTDAFAWLRDNPRLQVKASGRTKVGGDSATFVEFSVGRGYRFDNGNPANPCKTGSCVMLFRTLDLSPTLVGAVGGDTLRFSLVPEGPRLLVVTVSAPTAEYAAFSPEAQKVLATLTVGK